MTTSNQWQLASEAARRYEEILVPSILGPAARALVEAARIEPGDRVLDVGCGTGAAAGFAAARVGPKGSVLGVDVNEGMLECAKASLEAGGFAVELREANAAALPFDDGGFDVLLCAQSLQFMPDAADALSEMHRVARDGGRIAVSTWASIERSPYFHSLVEAMTRHVGAGTAMGLRAAFGLPDPDALEELLTVAGFRNVEVKEIELDLPLPDLEEFVPRHITATPMAAGYDAAPEHARAAVVRAVIDDHAGALTGAGVRVPFRPLIATAECS